MLEGLRLVQTPTRRCALRLCLEIETRISVRSTRRFDEITVDRVHEDSERKNQEHRREYSMMKRSLSKSDGDAKYQENSRQELI